MRYLLVGNAESNEVAVAVNEADVVIQINTCRHAALISEGLTKYVFLVNSGDQIYGVLERCPTSRLSGATIILARNPAFYHMKKWFMRLVRTKGGHLFKINKVPALEFPTKTVSFVASLRLDLRLIFLGMPIWMMPSTGMIAYEWIYRQMKAGDSLSIVGFTFEGWERHPWAIEKTLVKKVVKCQAK